MVGSRGRKIGHEKQKQPARAAQPGAEDVHGIPVSQPQPGVQKVYEPPVTRAAASAAFSSSSSSKHSAAMSTWQKKRSRTNSGVESKRRYTGRKVKIATANDMLNVEWPEDEAEDLAGQTASDVATTAARSPTIADASMTTAPVTAPELVPVVAPVTTPVVVAPVTAPAVAPAAAPAVAVAASVRAVTAAAPRASAATVVPSSSAAKRTVHAVLPAAAADAARQRMRTTGAAPSIDWLDQSMDELNDDPVAWPVGYSRDMYRHMRVLEDAQYAAMGDYVGDGSHGFAPNDRAVLVDWMVEATNDYQLSQDTLYLAVSLMDRFFAKVLTQKPFEQRELQLVAAVSLFLASKYEELRHPSLRCLLDTCDHQYSCEQAVRLERDLLIVVDYNLSVVTSKAFLRRILRLVSFMPAVVPPQRLNVYAQLSSYLCEMTLLHPVFLVVRPAVVAAAVMYVSGAVLALRVPWNVPLQVYTETSMENSCFLYCVEQVWRMHRGAAHIPYKSSRTKYNRPDFSEVARIPPLDAVPLTDAQLAIARSYSPPSRPAASSVSAAAASSSAAHPLPVPDLGP